MRTLIALVRNLLRLLFWPLAVASRRPVDVLRFVVRGSLPPVRRKRPFWDRRPRPISVRTLQRRMERAARDERLATVLVEVGHLGVGWSTLETLHEVVAAAGRTGAGKRVVAYLPEGATVREYYLASAADEIWMAPSATLALTGLAAESTYLAGALDRFGVTAQVEAVGRYKTAGEPLVETRMSAENQSMLGDILDEVEALVVPSIARGRRLAPERARELLGRGPYPPELARELGLVDRVCYPDRLPAELAEPGRREARLRGWTTYSRGRVLAFDRWPWQRKRLVVLDLHGIIVDGKSPGLKGVLGADNAVRTLRALRKDRSVAAVVLHVESRGGTVLGSDQIRREVERLGRRKPVIASMADVAASGGYMIASAAHTVVAQTATLTGSIGVLSAKLSIGRLLEGFGLRRQVVRRGDHSSFASAAEAWSASERAAVRAMIEAHYVHFLETVARGRRMPVDRIAASAEGRVWTGRAALERGLVDRLGGLPAAIAAAREASPEARRALVEAMAPASPRFPRLPLSGPVAELAALAFVARSAEVLALEPADLLVG